MSDIVKFSILCKKLAKTSGFINNIIDKRSPIMIMLNLLVEIDNQSMNITSTDSDMMISVKIDDIGFDGKVDFTVNSQMFCDIIRKIPEDGLINFEIRNESVIITYDSLKFTLPSLDPRNFPKIQIEEKNTEFQVSLKDFSNIINRTKFAISNDEARYYLNGICLHFSEEENGIYLNSIATDGHKLAIAKVQATEKKFDNNIIVPKKAVSEMMKILSANNAGSEEELFIAISKTKISFKIGGNFIISKLIDGEFPDYKQVIPKSNNNVLSVNKKKFADVIDLIATIATDKYKSIKINCFSDEKIEISANNNEGYFANKEIEAEYNGDKMQIFFNIRYISEVLSQIDEDDIMFELGTSASPALIYGKRNVYNRFIVMPIRG